jgi:hypothetical protein
MVSGELHETGEDPMNEGIVELSYEVGMDPSFCYRTIKQVGFRDSNGKPKWDTIGEDASYNMVVGKVRVRKPEKNKGISEVR